MADSILADIQEVYNEIGDTLYFVKLKTTTPTNIYGEVKKKSLDTPITLVGMVDFQPKPEILSDIGLQRKVSVVFKVAYQTLIDTGISLMSESDVLKSQIKYNDEYYNIVNYVPRSLYQGDFLIYNFECIRG